MSKAEDICRQIEERYRALPNPFEDEVHEVRERVEQQKQEAVAVGTLLFGLSDPRADPIQLFDGAGFAAARTKLDADRKRSAAFGQLTHGTQQGRLGSRLLKGWKGLCL